MFPKMMVGGRVRNVNRTGFCRGLEVRLRTWIFSEEGEDKITIPRGVRWHRPKSLLQELETVRRPIRKAPMPSDSLSGIVSICMLKALRVLSHSHTYLILLNFLHLPDHKALFPKNT